MRLKRNGHRYLVRGLGIAAAVLCSTAFLASAQTRIVKTNNANGYAAVSGSTLTGHVTVGDAIAGRVEGSTMKGWIGFFPVKMPTRTSVDEDADTKMAPHPNPTSDHITIPGVSESARVSLIDGTGKILTVPIKLEAGSMVLDVRSVPNGTYSVAVLDGKTSKLYRVVVLR